MAHLLNDQQQRHRDRDTPASARHAYDRSRIDLLFVHTSSYFFLLLLRFRVYKAFSAECFNLFVQPGPLAFI